jgi:mono/diheme cytochrome c family protein
MGLILLLPLIVGPALRESSPNFGRSPLDWLRAVVHEVSAFFDRTFQGRSRTRMPGTLRPLPSNVVFLRDCEVKALALLADGEEPQTEPVKEEDLRSGLVATHRDAANREVVQLEPTIALALKAGEAAHPRLAADGSVRWQGYLNVLRAGDYRFSAMLRGKLHLKIGDKEVLAAEVKDDAPARRDGPETRLEAGVHPLVAEFMRLPGPGRVELLWKSAHIHPEPLPFDQLGHLPRWLPARQKADARIEHGRFLVEEHNCIACHRPAEEDRMARGLLGRQGPDLSQVGQRAHAGWLDRWLDAPDKVRPGAAMPRVFSADAVGKAERHAVARYLASLGGPLKPNPRPPDAKTLEESAARGQRLFVSVGCIACHPAPEAKEKREATARRWPITGLGSKTTPEQLSAYLQNPRAVDPSGRMPNMFLQAKEADDLARYLCRSKEQDIPVDLPAAPAQADLVAAFRRADPRPEELAAFQKLPADAQLLDLGKRVVIDRGCNNCHTIAPGGQPFANTLADASLNDLKKPAAHDRGCMASDGRKRGAAPSFGLTPEDRGALALFLSDGLQGAGSAAPAHAARRTLQRFNCLACHSRDGEGGLSPDLVEQLRQYEKAENAEAVVPPPLTDVGHKLRTPWLRQVLVQAGRGRPWMGLRMPQFGEDHVGKLPEMLAALDGVEPDEQVRQAPLTAARIEAGRQLVGKSAFGCISCHDLAGIANTGTRGPDLAGMNQRVRYDWYRRWLEQPQRMQPGTRMPSVFSQGKSLFDKLLAGDGDAQAEAMWAYLSLGPSLPLPEGMEPPKGLVLQAKERPIIVRTFLPEAGARAIAVGFPGDIAAAFDAATCRLAYAWSGNFLDVSPVWEGRGGNPAKVLGTRFWTAPPGCPWETTTAAQPPDFTARAKDPAYGAALPEGKLYTGPQQLRFEGYAADADGRPIFRYQIHAATPAPIEVTERATPLRSTAGVGLARHWSVPTPAGQTSWLLAGETGKTPRALDDRLTSLSLDLQADTIEAPAATRLLVLPQEGDRLIVLAVKSATEGSRWVLRRQAAGWQALLRLPATREAARREVSVQTWALYRDDAALLRELLPTR